MHFPLGPFYIQHRFGLVNKAFITSIKSKHPEMITFYDIPSATRRAWSPNTWKVRYCLNLKKLPYQTEWIEYPDIASRLQEIGIPSTGKRDDGTPLYTLPAIRDSTTGVVMSDSLSIAQYLEKQYPDTPSIFPQGTWGLQAIFHDAVGVQIAHVRPFAIHDMCDKLNPIAQEFFKKTREVTFEKNFGDIKPRGEEAQEQWAQARAGWRNIALWYSGTTGPFIMGSTVSWADFVVGGQLIWYRTAFGDKSKEWEDVMSWDDGYWGRFSDAMKKYEDVV